MADTTQAVRSEVLSLTAKLEQIGLKSRPRLTFLGSGSSNVVIDNLQRSVKQVVALLELSTGETEEAWTRALETLEGNLQVSATYGLITATQLDDYLVDLDRIYTIIRKDT